MKLTFDSASIFLDGKRKFLVSGEFHYFRVPREDWRRRMELLKEAGGNCLATYVPWLIHEPEEGTIAFGDRPERDLAAFLGIAQEAGLAVIVRPGPYQYSELVNDGLPGWLVSNYPNLRAKKADGGDIRRSSVSYMHPLFLEKARRYFRAFADTVRPFLSENGGPVVLVQLDNELSGIHIWFHGEDYNPETFGFGREDGRYPAWLRGKYGDVNRLNAAYGTSWGSFSEARPLPCDGRTPEAARSARDYRLCYLAQVAEYMRTLKGWLREDGIESPLCHNAANPAMNTYFREALRDLGPDFLLGSDHYYTLGQRWDQENPTPSYLFSMQFSCDTMRAMGNPPVVFEMPGGSPSDMPPILVNDLLAAYMANLAMGMKGLNYYVFTGGPNFPGTGSTCDIYDYNALVRADGSKNETYAAAKAFGELLRGHGELLESERFASVQIGVEFDAFRGACGLSPDPDAPNADEAREFAKRGLLYSLHCSRYSARHVDLEQPLDTSRPLLVAAMGMMSEAAQRRVADFVQAGGDLVIAPCVPRHDLDLNPCTLLADALGVPPVSTNVETGPVLEMGGLRIYQLSPKGVFAQLPDGVEPIVKDPSTGAVLGCMRHVGQGRVVALSFTWHAALFSQSVMLEKILGMLGAEPSVASSNRNVFTVRHDLRDGGTGVFALNLHASPQTTELTVFRRGGKPAATLPLSLRAMEVRYERLP